MGVVSEAIFEDLRAALMFANGIAYKIQATRMPKMTTELDCFDIEVVARLLTIDRDVAALLTSLFADQFRGR